MPSPEKCKKSRGDRVSIERIISHRVKKITYSLLIYKIATPVNKIFLTTF